MTMLSIATTLCARVALGALAAAGAAAQSATSFEGLPAGPLTRLATDLGTWWAAPGHAAIDAAHASDGAQCLRLLGGTDSAVTLELAGGARRLWAIAFRAERWTRAAPFAFRLDVRSGGRWRTVHDASDEVVIGGFRANVRAIVADGPTPGSGAPVDALRFVCTSPPDRGVLIDELELLAPGPMRIRTCTATRPAVPLLVGGRSDPILRIDIETDGNLEPLELRELHVALTGTAIGADLARTEVFRADGDDAQRPLRDELRFGREVDRIAETLVFRDRLQLAPGRLRLWVVATPAPGADLDHVVAATCTSLELAGGARITPEPTGSTAPQRLGIALRDAGADGVAGYRIPGLCTTPNGTLVAVYDVRRRNLGDLPGDIDVGTSRSIDGGRTWSPMRIAIDMGDSPAARGDGVGDPSILVDPATGRVIVMALWSHGDRAWRGSGPGLAPDDTGQLVVVHSDDDGETWSAPRNLTSTVKDPAWSLLLQGPGRGIAMHDGTLVFPAQFLLPDAEKREPRSTVLWSRDHGDTWHIGSAARPDTTESTVVELQDGVLMLNMRDNRGGSRAVAVSSDLGATWTEHPTSRTALVEPVCNASLLHVGRELGRGADGLLLFCNPAVPRAPRRDMTLRASPDFGASWPDARRVLLDEGVCAGYPCLTMVDERTVGVLYESSRAHLAFQRIPLVDLVGATRDRR
ncbi:MAG: exo-alpha-sialidase [Planctomycetes bacterium]|nr:exo-alpha-sialidase [Planctomycetota bacterium]